MPLIQVIAVAGTSVSNTFWLFRVNEKQRKKSQKNPRDKINVQLSKKCPLNCRSITVCTCQNDDVTLNTCILYVYSPAIKEMRNRRAREVPWCRWKVVLMRMGSCYNYFSIWDIPTPSLMCSWTMAKP